MSYKMKLNNVRLSFPSIWQKAVFDGKETKFEATFLINKDEQADLISKIESKIEQFLEEKFGKGKVPKSVKRTCLVDGDTKDYDGYENHMAFKAASNRRFTIIDKDKSPLVEDDGKPYAGCYVNAIVDLWYSDHVKGGKQVLGNLLGIQFVRDGEAFGAGGADVSDEFDELDDTDDDEF